MITTYLSLYLVFIIVIALVISLIVWRLHLPSPRLVISLLLLFIVSPLIVGYIAIIYFDSLPETIVPEVIGLTWEQAQAKLEEADVRPRLAGNVYEMKYPEGSVVSQRPEAGRRVKVGRVVNLMISSGKRRVKVPDLIGRPLTQVQAVLLAAGLQVGQVREEKNQEVASGAVITQEPLPGEEVETGRLVDLLVSATNEVTVIEENEEVVQ